MTTDRNWVPTDRNGPYVKKLNLIVDLCYLLALANVVHD